MVALVTGTKSDGMRSRRTQDGQPLQAEGMLERSSKTAMPDIVYS